MLNEQEAVDFYRVILTKIESRDFDNQPVPRSVKKAVLEAARQSGSGNNTQHWRFIFIQEKADLKRLASDSTTGQWVANADFAVIVLTDPQYRFHMIDAGRAVQSMMLAAWSFKVASGIFTGVNLPLFQKDFALPSNLNVTAVVGFGYPKQKILGKKDRKPLSEIAFQSKFGQPLTL